MSKAVERDGAIDQVAVELPLEIRLNGEPVAVTMRTPGHDFELAAGFLFGEGIVDTPPEVDARGGPGREHGRGARAAAPTPPSARRFYTTSSCGICGKGALEEVEAIAPRVEGGPVDRARAARRRCRTACASPRSSAPAGSTPPGCSTPPASCCSCARTWAATTPWTRWSARRCWRARLPLAESDPLRERAAGLRARPEGRARGRPDPRGGGRAHVARGRSWPTTGASRWPGSPAAGA